MSIRIEARDHQYNPPNTAYIYQRKDGSWGCVLANGTPAAMSYAGIEHSKEMALKFELEDASTAEEAMAAVLRNARYYLSGPKAGQSVYTYEVFDTGKRIAAHAAGVLTSN